MHGYLPYRDFIMVQPPGITLLMAPVALVTKGLGTAWGMARGPDPHRAGRAAAVAGWPACWSATAGLLAVILTCGILAVYPASVQAAHTVLLEPWLVLFCLAGALAVFDGDRMASTRRLVWGGVAFGFAGAIKVWAILPVAGHPGADRRPAAAAGAGLRRRGGGRLRGPGAAVRRAGARGPSTAAWSWPSWSGWTACGSRWLPAAPDDRADRLHQPGPSCC